MQGKLFGRRKTAVLAVIISVLLASHAAGAGKGTAASTGLALYTKHCANCHGRPEKSLLSNCNASLIRSVIAQSPAMSGLKGLTDAEIAAIAATLANQTSAK